MLFQKKVDRAMDYVREKDGGEDQTQEEKEEKISQEIEKGDTLAMILSALLVLVPVALVVLLLLVLFGALPLLR